jgi:hypothetical protein
MMLYHAACAYARAVEQLAKVSRERDVSVAEKVVRWQARAVALLRELLELVPKDERRAFWRENIEHERNLLAIRNSRGMNQLWQDFAR